MAFLHRSTNNFGQSLIELLIVMALMAMLLPVLLGGLIASREGRPQQLRRAEAAQKLKQAQEALRSIREGSWDTIATNGTYHAINDGTAWSLVSGSITENELTTEIAISDVRRDSSNTIVPSGGTIDPSTKQVTLSVSWLLPFPTTMTSQIYLARYLGNATYIQTTEADFNTGTHTETVTTNVEGGEVILGSGGHGDWCVPETSIVAEFNLPGSGNARRVRAIEGKAFSGTSSGGGTFVELGVSNANPPIVSQENLITGYETRDIYIDNNYAYIATADTSRDVVIVDLNTGLEVGYFNDPDIFGSTQGVFVKDNVGYAVIGPRLHTFDLSSKSGSRPQLDSERLRPGFLLWLFVQGYRLHVVGNYAYVALSGWTDSEMRVVNVSNPSNLALGAKANVTNGQDGREIFVNELGTRTYLATAQSAQAEFFIINTDVSNSNKNNSNYNLSVISSYNTNGMDPNGGVSVVTGNRALLVGTGAEEYQVLDISDESNPTRCGGLNIDSNIYGVSAVLEADGDAYSYIVTGDTSNEFKVIIGGPGGSSATEGVYESAVFDVGYSAAFNRLIPTATIPLNTSLSYQIAIADPVGGSCALSTYVFTGPDGSVDTYYNTTDGIMFHNDSSGYENPGRCFRYRAYLSTTDPASTPVLNDVIVNYSP